MLKYITHSFTTNSYSYSMFFALSKAVTGVTCRAGTAEPAILVISGSDSEPERSWLRKHRARQNIKILMCGATHTAEASCLVYRLPVALSCNVPKMSSNQGWPSASCFDMFFSLPKITSKPHA